MGFDRTDRISEEVRIQVDKIIRDELNDPRIGGTYSILRAEVTRDLRYAKIRVSIYEQERRADMMAALKKAAGFIRRELGHRMDLRYVPELIFELDTSIEYAAHINELLKESRTNDDDQCHCPVDRRERPVCADGARPPRRRFAG